MPVDFSTKTTLLNNLNLLNLTEIIQNLQNLPQTLNQNTTLSPLITSQSTNIPSTTVSRTVINENNSLNNLIPTLKNNINANQTETSSIRSQFFNQRENLKPSRVVLQSNAFLNSQQSSNVDQIKKLQEKERFGSTIADLKLDRFSTNFPSLNTIQKRVTEDIQKSILTTTTPPTATRKLSSFLPFITRRRIVPIVSSQINDNEDQSFRPGMLKLFLAYNFAIV